MCSSVCEEDGVVVIDEGCGVIQSGLPPSMILAVPAFVAEPPVLKGMGVCIVLLGTWDEFMEGVRTWMGVHQQSQWCVGFLYDGCMEGSGKLLDEGGLKVLPLLVQSNSKLNREELSLAKLT